MTKYSPCLSHLYAFTYVDLMGSFTVQWLDAAEFGQDLLEIFITDIETIVSGEAPRDEGDDRKDAASMETAASLIRYFARLKNMSSAHSTRTNRRNFLTPISTSLVLALIYSISQLLQHHFQSIGRTRLTSSNSNSTSSGAGSGNACSRAEGHLFIRYSR